MRAGVFMGPRDIAVQDVPDPAAGPDDVVVEVRAAGICGSDLHTWTEGAFVEPGQVSGHEFAGVVTEVGDAVAGLRVGDRVTANPMLGCRACVRCREGDEHLCTTLFTRSIAYGLPGAFAERVLIPGATLGQTIWKLGDDVGFEDGALVEPLAVAVHATRIAEAKPGQSVLVLGLGTIGLLVAQVLLGRGCERVIGIDLAALRLRAASDLGVIALDGREDPWGEIARLLGPDGELDAVYECSGAPQLMGPAMETVRSGGTIAMLALYDEPLPIDATMVAQKELRLQGSIAYSAEDFTAAVQMIGDGGSAAGALVTDRAPLEQLGGAFERQLDKERSIKVMITAAARPKSI